MGGRALVVGGTGPTGPDVLHGLLSRGFETSMFHSGRHEIPMSTEIEHIHGDPHFLETIAEALAGREFDVVIAQYGRLRHLIDFLRGRTAHLIAIGGMNAPLASASDPRWGALGRPAVLREEDRLLLEAPAEDNKLGFKIAEASRKLFAAREEGAFKATYIVYPVLYGPRQPGSPEWHVVRRIRDGRRQLIVPDAGLRLESRGYVHNVSQAPLLAADQPGVADGKTYVVADRDIFTTRQRVDFIAQHMGVDLEIVDMPFDIATPAHPLYRHGGAHRTGLADRIRIELGFSDQHTTEAALRSTIDWLLSPQAMITEIETQLGDAFDYGFEDRLISWWEGVKVSAPKPAGEYGYSHIYRHPKEVGEDWSRK